MTPLAARTPKRCAIYTRKSNDERQDAQFTTLQNQREYCAAYIASQAGEGWSELADHYDDGGFSGGTLSRPALERLRTDIAEGKLDVVVVYKIDRLSRSLRDFANLVAEFGKFGVTFVSVTQAFDTATSMGRLTLNVLLSFAQFEREVTGERIKDWFTGARHKGLWVPKRPFGYAKSEGHILVPHPIEAPIVKWAYERYWVLKSCRLVADELFDRGVLNRSGRPWSGNLVNHMLTHPVYVGKMSYYGVPEPGIHEAIVTPRLWQRVQSTLQVTRCNRGLARQPAVSVMLKGLLFDRRGMRMHHSFLTSKGKLYRYYIAGGEKRRYGNQSTAHMRFRAAELEASVLALVDRLVGYARPERPASMQREDVRRLVERIHIDDNDMEVVFRTGAVVRGEPGGRIGPFTRRARRENTSRRGDQKATHLFRAHGFSP